jgi:hypothetical protein
MSAKREGDPMGEANWGALRLVFDRRLLLAISQLLTDAGLLAYRELDDTLCLSAREPIRRLM